MTIDVPAAGWRLQAMLFKQYEGVRTNAGRLAETAVWATVGPELGLVDGP